MKPTDKRFLAGYLAMESSLREPKKDISYPVSEEAQKRFLIFGVIMFIAVLFLCR